jgi:hypothetical protein
MSRIGLLRREGTPKVVFGKPGNVRRRLILILFKDMLRRWTCTGGRGRRNELKNLFSLLSSG